MSGEPGGPSAASSKGECSVTSAASGGLPSADGKTRVGNYEILSKIGESVTGTVFKARQRSMDRIVALKLLKPRLATDKDFVERFRRDVRVVARLNHPNIVSAYDTGHAGGYFYFAMEYVDGHDLGTVLLTSVTLEDARALGVVLDVANALECAHEANTVHRDVRPGNILIAPDGTAKLAGLGFKHNDNDTDARSPHLIFAHK
jgi:serine/threonine-protein kinase